MNKEIINIIEEWKHEAGVKGIILVSRHADTHSVIKICTHSPKDMIGEKYALINKYRAKLKEINPNLKHIELVNTEMWYIR